MQVAHKGRVADLADLGNGSIFLTDFGGWPLVRAMKAVYMRRPDIHAGKVVTVGPFRDEDGGKPGVYEPHAVRRSSVVDVTDILTFTFSTDPRHIEFDLPSPRECVGLAVIVETNAFLGCQFYRGGDSWEAAYLNMATGEIVFDINAGKACISREWSLQETL
jgi:hypothetical protein